MLPDRGGHHATGARSMRTSVEVVPGAPRESVDG